ncbi:MAG: acetylornithine deacetylase [Methylococcales bacterium]
MSTGIPLPDTRSMIATLIETPSISSTDSSIDQSNLAVINLLADWLETADFHIDIIPVSETKANLIATLGNREQSDGLILSGHTDTVPYDTSRWTSDPFCLTEKDNRLYGLGTADMKSFFALVLEAVQGYQAKNLQHPLVVLATADEESTMSGAKALVENQTPLGRYAVIGEPTSLRPIRMHKGVMMESIRISGKSGHSSNPALGASASEGMLKLLNSLIDWRQTLQKDFQNPAFEVDIPTVNIGSIHGGDNPNRICAFCESLIDIRLMPGMEIANTRRDLMNHLIPLFKDNTKLTVKIEPLFDGIPAFETPADALIIGTTEKLTGYSADAVAFATEAPFFKQMDIETVVLGPGSINQAHQPDEFISLSELQPTVNLIRKLIEHFCIRD